MEPTSGTPGGATAPAGFLFDGRYIEAFLSAPEHRVLGQVLKPFSIWHKTQLEFHNSPLIQNASVGVADLALAVAVCQTQFPETAQYCPPLKGVRGWWRRIQMERVNLPKELAAFEAYLGDYWTPPKLEKMNKPGQMTESQREPDMDEALGEVSLYREYTGCPREEPWNLPIGELYWMNVAFARSKGSEFLIITPLEEARRARLRARRQAKLDKRAAELVSTGLSDEAAQAQALAEHRDSLRIKVKHAAPGKGVKRKPKRT